MRQASILTAIQALIHSNLVVLHQQQMFIPSINAIYYAPHNTWSFNNLSDYEICKQYEDYN